MTEATHRARCADDGPDLIFPVLIHPNGIGRGCYATGRHDLDAMGSASLELTARSIR